MVGRMTTIRQQATLAFDKIQRAQPDAIQTGSIQQPAPVTGGGPSDPTGGAQGPAPDPIHVRMAVFEIGADRVNGTSILAGDFQVVVEAGPIEFSAADTVVCDRGRLAIVQLGRIASGGETALYDMICRGARA